jgi:hypothetical protein
VLIQGTEAGWITPDASWLYREGADEEEVLILNMVKAGKKRPPKCSWMRKNSKHG